MMRIRVEINIFLIKITHSWWILLEIAGNPFENLGILFREKSKWRYFKEFSNTFSDSSFFLFFNLLEA